MFQMASPWDSFGLQSGDYRPFWASGPGTRRKRMADPFDFGRSWIGEESDDSDRDSYQDDAYRSRGPRRAAPHPSKWFCDPMTAQGYRTAAADATPAAKPKRSGTAAATAAAMAAPGNRVPGPQAGHPHHHPQAQLQRQKGLQQQEQQQQQQQQQQQYQYGRQQPFQQHAFMPESSPQFISAAHRRQQQARTMPRSQPAAIPRTSAAAAAAAMPPAAASTTGVPTRIPVRTEDGQAGPRPSAAQPAASAAKTTPPRSAGCNTTRAVSSMTSCQAASTIQRWWRGWRLWRHAPALRQLVALSAELRAAVSRFEEHLASSGGNLTDKQQLEVNELAMRAILKLDGLEGLPQELRALRKGLTAKALRLQDDVHNTYNRSSERPAHLRSAGPAACAAAAPASDTRAAKLESAAPQKCNDPGAQSPSAGGSTATKGRQSPAASSQPSPAASPSPSSSPSPASSPAASRQPSPHRQTSPMQSPKLAAAQASPMQAPLKAASQPSTPRRPPSRRVSAVPTPTSASTRLSPASSLASSPPLSPSSSALLSDSYKSCTAVSVRGRPTGHGSADPRAWALSDCSLSHTFSSASDDDLFDDALEGDCDIALCVDDEQPSNGCCAKAMAEQVGACKAAAGVEDEEVPEVARAHGPWWSARRLWRSVRGNRSRRNRH